MWEDVRRCEKMWEDVRRCEKMRRWGEDGRMRRCEDEKMWRWEDVKMWRWEDVKMRRCEDEKMWRWEDVKMRGCEDEKMWRWEDVKMRGCEDERMWRWEDVKMRRCFTDPHYWKNPALRRSRELRFSTCSNQEKFGHLVFRQTHVLQGMIYHYSNTRSSLRTSPCAVLCCTVTTVGSHRPDTLSKTIIWLSMYAWRSHLPSLPVGWFVGKSFQQCWNPWWLMVVRG